MTLGAKLEKAGGWAFGADKSERYVLMLDRSEAMELVTAYHAQIAAPKEAIQEMIYRRALEGASLENLKAEAEARAEGPWSTTPEKEWRRAVGSRIDSLDGRMANLESELRKRADAVEETLNRHADALTKRNLTHSP